MHKRTRATNIKTRVKRTVEERDGGCCIFCGRRGRGEAHVIPRSHGGLGVEQNLITVCRECHFQMDDTIARPLFLELAKKHLKKFYPDWTTDSVIYKKGIKTEQSEGWKNKNLVNNTNLYLEDGYKLEKTKYEGFYFLKEEDKNEPD